MGEVEVYYTRAERLKDVKEIGYKQIVGYCTNDEGRYGHILLGLHFVRARAYA